MKANAGSPHWQSEHGSAARGTSADATTSDKKRHNLRMILLLEPPAGSRGTSPGGRDPVVSSSGARNAGRWQVESREAGERAGGGTPRHRLRVPGQGGRRRRRQQRDGRGQ